MTPTEARSLAQECRVQARKSPFQETKTVLEKSKIALRSLADQVEALQKALKFYARHEHWMAAHEDGPHRLLVANTGDAPAPQDGWLVAENVIASAREAT